MSYASEDAEAAHRLCSSLRTAGIDVWLDQSELQGGDAWERQIRDRICDCRLFIAIVSSNTEARDEGFFRREWKLAVDRIDDLAEDVTFLLPVSIDGTIQARARVPRKFLEVQWTTLPRGNATPEFIHRVVRLLGRETGIVEQRPVARPDASKQLLPKSRIRPILTTTVAVAIAGALAYGVVERRRQATIPLALRSVAVGSAQTGDRSLAVLPFVDMSEKHDQEFFADGMSEEILDVLTRIPELTVIGRTSSFQFKGKNEDLRTIGRQLGTTYVVEGSVRRSGDRVRVTAQLIDTRSGSHVWSESYDRDMGDVLMLQNTIATSIARKLQLAVTSSGSATAGLPRNIDAYTLYLRGREAFDRGDVAAYTEAQQYFEQALALDSTSSRAAEGVLLSYINRVYAGEIESAVGWPKVRSLAQNLLELDPQSSFAHSALSWYHYLYDYDWIACNREIDAVIATRSHEPNTLVYAAYAAGAVRRSTDASRLIHEALIFDPLSADAYQALGGILNYNSDYAGAQRAWRKSLEISPTIAGSHQYIAETLLAIGKPKEAQVEALLEPPSVGRDAVLAATYYELGHKRESDESLNRIVNGTGNTGDRLFYAASVYGWRRENDLAFEYLAKAYAARDLSLSIDRSQYLMRLHSDPRWAPLLIQMNIPR